MELPHMYALYCTCILAYGIYPAQCAVEYADRGREAESHVERSDSLVGVLTAMENVGQVEKSYVHGIPEGKHNNMQFG